MSYILLLAGWYPSAADNYVGDFVQRHAKAIALYKPVVVLYIAKSNVNKKLIVEKTVNGNLTEIIIYYSSKSWGAKIASHLKYKLLTKKYIDEIITEYGKPPIVHAYIAWKGGLMAQYIKRRYGIPFVLSDQSSAYYQNDPFFVKKYPIRFRILKKIFNETTAFISISEVYYKNCRNLFGTKVPLFIAENNVDTNLFYYQEKENEKPVIVHVSTMDFPKNLEGLLRGVSEVAKVNNNFCLQLIGTVHQNVIDEVARLKLSDIVEMKGWLPYDKVAEQVRSADLKILFSRYEGMPCVVLEALCSGVPVISTSVGAVPELLNSSNGILIKEGDEAALTQSILEWLSRRNEYDNKKIAEQSSAKYSFEAIGKKIVDVYLALESN